MLDFFRKYQTYFFAVITFVIVISFSFFGTFNALPANSTHEQVAFTAIDGTSIKRGEVDDMALFIGTDSDDKKLFGGVWGPNFLNDGVIHKDFLETGLAQLLVNAYPHLLEKDLQARLEKERHYVLYSHPQAPFLNIEGVWGYFAPSMKANFDALRLSSNGIDEDSFTARVGLFLDERKLPAPLLKQILRYQEKQYSWLSPDPNLERVDLSLFGYHTLDDWFGPRFIRLVAEFIINSSKIAKEKGYEVTKAEALAELVRNSEKSYQENLRAPHLGVANKAEYFNEQLRRLGMDQNKAVHVWQQVMLSRRMFHDIGNAVLVDPLAHEQFFGYAQESVDGNLYRLPQQLRFGDYRLLQKFEMYLDAVAKREKDVLSLPTKFHSLEQVKKNYPELVQKRYLVKLSQVQKSALQSKVSLKEMWNWELEEANWLTLKKEFPELGLKKGDTREERLTALDGMDDLARSRLDALARKSIVEMHPEWLQSSLEESEAKQMVLGVRLKGGRAVLGLENREELISLLDTASLGDQPSEKLKQYTADGKTYYRIAVLEKNSEEEILTFAEANQEGVLDQLLDKQLEAAYPKLRDKQPELFRKDDASWKAFAEVKTEVADLYFEKLLKAIRSDYEKGTENKGQQLATGNLAAPLRFYAHMRQLQAKLQANNSEATEWVREEPGHSSSDSLPVRTVLSDQWKIEKTPRRLARSDNTQDLDKTVVFAMAVDEWMPVQTLPNGDLTFFQLKKKDVNVDASLIAEKAQESHQLISDDAQRIFMHHVLNMIHEKNAISLDYLDVQVESLEPEEQRSEIEI